MKMIKNDTYMGCVLRITIRIKMLGLLLAYDTKYATYIAEVSE